MGAICAPTCANKFRAKIEEKYIYIFKYQCQQTLALKESAPLVTVHTPYALNM